MKLLIVTDAWRPQINGVVRTLEMTAEELARLGHEVRIVGPKTDRWATFAAPFYPEIKLELFANGRLARIFDEFAPDAVHIATEGPLGFAARRICLERDLGFSTAYHTRFPEYLAQRRRGWSARLIRASIYALLRHFHRPSSAVMVATASIERELVAKGFARLERWSRGVDLGLFRPQWEAPSEFVNLPRPRLLYVGRLAVEKNLPGFLGLKTPGSKIVVGDGPEFEALKKAYPDAHFLGARHGAELARCYAAADLFVFPSLTDTFGLVLLEACASGLRVAALPAPDRSTFSAATATSPRSTPTSAWRSSERSPGARTPSPRARSPSASPGPPAPASSVTIYAQARRRRARPRGFWTARSFRRRAGSPRTKPPPSPGPCAPPRENGRSSVYRRD